MNYRSIDSMFAVAGQLQPSAVIEIAEAGFKTIVCARPDYEDPGQPTFAEIASKAAALGLQAVHIPISGGVTDGAVSRMNRAMREMPKPMFGYCRSGNRAGNLYSAAVGDSQ
jgi:uncharacterized protein (TIGR01244 family)